MVLLKNKLVANGKMAMLMLQNTEKKGENVV